MIINLFAKIQLIPVLKGCNVRKLLVILKKTKKTSTPVSQPIDARKNYVMKKKYQSLNLKPEAFAKIAASVRRAAKNDNALSTSVMNG